MTRTFCFRALFIGAFLVALSGGAGGPVALRAQEVAQEMHLSLDDCVRIALENNSAVIQARYGRDIDDVNVDGARAAFMPSISSRWSLSRSISGPREGSFLDPSSGVVITTVGESTTSGAQTAGIDLNMSVFDAADFATLAATKHGYRSSLMTLARDKSAVTYQAKQRYFQVLQAISLLEVQKEQVRVSEESLRRAETLNEIGSAPISQVYSARAQLESARVTLISRENDVEVSRSNLADALGLGADERIVPTQTEFGIDSVRVSYEDALGRVEHHPDLLARRFDMLQAKNSLRATQLSQRFPTFGVGVGYSWQLSKDENFRGIEDLFLKNYSYRVSFSANMPIFQLNTSVNAKRQRIQYLNTLELYNQAKRTRALQVKQAFLELERLRRTITAGQASVQAAEQDFRLQDEAFNFGAGTFLERQQAQVNLFRERATLVQSRYSYQIQMANLENILGTGVDEDEVNEVLDSQGD